ncbi:MAG: ABC transporter permease [Actinobacteria bacterium]|nr:ABC transporter permease [Actinomycetota bacterium]
MKIDAILKEEKKIKFPKSLAAALVILSVWLVITSMKLVDPVFIPGPLNLWDSLLRMRNTLPLATLRSLSMTLAGFGLGTLWGVFLGLLMAYSKTFMETTGPIFDFIRPVPIFALIPLFLLWFGPKVGTQIAFIALGVSVVLGVTTYEAIRNIPIVYIRAAFNLGASRMRVYRTVILPCIFPHLIGAIRVAAAASWGLDVAAEFMGAQVGLGYNMIIQQIYLNTGGIIIIVIIYSILAIALDLTIRKIESYVTRWTERAAILHV